MRFIYCSALLIITSAAILPSTAYSADAAGITELQHQAQQRIKGFATELKAALGSAIQQGGLINGVTVCKEQAPLIAEKWSGEGWQLGRTSIKIRNSQNTPDSWEQAILQSFAERLAQGDMPGQLNHAEIISDDGNKTFRYMQPIMLDTVCQACHGSKVAAPVIQAIQQHYPNDLATGYTEGELRGAFTVQKQL